MQVSFRDSNASIICTNNGRHRQNRDQFLPEPLRFENKDLLGLSYAGRCGLSQFHSITTCTSQEFPTKQGQTIEDSLCILRNRLPYSAERSTVGESIRFVKRFRGFPRNALDTNFPRSIFICIAGVIDFPCRALPLKPANFVERPHLHTNLD